MKKKEQIAIVAGGTGGHFFPAQSLAEIFVKQGYFVRYFLDKRCKPFIPSSQDHLEYKVIASGGIAAMSWQKKSMSFLRLGVGFLQSLYFLITHRPKAVIGFGGYPAIPLFMAAICLHIPIFIHEQNAVMGRTNRLFASFAKRIYTGLPLHEKHIKTHWVGTPVRSAIMHYQQSPYPESASVFRLLVLGGSLGASIFSELIPQAIALLDRSLQERIYVMQQCRQEFMEITHAAYRSIGVEYQLDHFIDHVGEAISNSHFIISRAGASTVSEMAIIGRPVLFMPYPHAIDDHQTKNAYSVCKQEGDISSCWVVQEKKMTAKKLADMLKTHIENHQNLQKSAQLIHHFAKPKAADHLAESIIKML